MLRCQKSNYWHWKDSDLQRNLRHLLVKQSHNCHKFVKEIHRMQVNHKKTFLQFQQAEYKTFNCFETILNVKVDEIYP